MKKVGIGSIEIEPDFEPSMKIIARILKTMTDKHPRSKTQLSLDSNIQYTRLAKHIVWLEKRGLVESKIEATKINIALTKEGKAFTSIISNID